MTSMTPEQLRQTIVRATIPHVGEYDTLTTAQIARTAGVDEADLLAVFSDKDAVMQACAATLAEAVDTAMSPAEEVREIDAIRTDQPLASRLVQVIDILDAYYRRIRIDLDDLLPAGPGGDVEPIDVGLSMSGSLPVTGTADAPGTPPSGPQDQLLPFGRSPELRQAVAKQLEPDEQTLRLPAQVLAKAFVAMIFGGVRPAEPNQALLPAEKVVDLFLHGALNTD
jgi:AcrR family transcriptional regulator